LTALHAVVGNRAASHSGVRLPPSSAGPWRRVGLRWGQLPDPLADPTSL